ncbi:hypothetical protein SY83_10230 [Paenibacillus swuensis]|uniref:Chemotaxis protein CheY n=1 Tax=Paenibacillus swuensis TaxID=1178515 RepID=A0A172TI97_9BACL|nr:response regulator [Paenibacillus swuensis]ANE46587.1 hypothetical protein SY83_10230 [Paenibacillus swuensis]
MIRAIIVDDEKLVRKGLISMMPWQAFGIDIIADAPSVAKALELLQQQEADLLITDLTMPSMSGFELMREVRQHYPHMRVVVLTCHQDFDYIQEALRLGAIDYIVKTQLEKEKTEDVLGRIVNRMCEENTRDPKLPATAVMQAEAKSERGFLLCGTGKSTKVADLYAIPWVRTGSLYEVEQGTWLVPRPSDAVVASDIQAFLDADVPEWILVEVEGMRGLPIGEVCRLLKEYKQGELFYEWQRDTRVYNVSASAIEKEHADQEDTQISRIKERWSMPNWVLDDKLYGELLADIELQRLPSIHVKRSFYAAMALWEVWFKDRKQLNQWNDQVEDLLYWEDWSEWLDSTRKHLRTVLGAVPHSEEVVRSIYKAVEYMKTHVGKEVNQREVAKAVNMSRSYFSQCFKDITGLAFGEMLRDARIESAKTQLLQTQQPIYWIAEQSGFQDEKYFRRIFKEQTGMTPTEYRATSMRGSSVR